MSRLPPRPLLSWKPDATPVDDRFGDVYFSRENGLWESRAVFLEGCGLPQAWRGQAHFTIAELGFGTGLNFLACWQAWEAEPENCGWLHFVSFEGYLLDAEDVRRALEAWPELSHLADKLCRAWPLRAQGVQQIVWPEARITLTLYIGLIEDTLPQARFAANAWFLDGFSPAKNDQMWDETIWPAVAARSAPGARAATFTVAGRVRRGLSEAGFTVTKRPGHGRKRERLEAVWESDAAPASLTHTPDLKRVAIVGAGIAGACLAYRCQQAGLTVSLFDRASGPGSGASGNRLALLMPRLDAGDTAQSRLLVDAYIAAQRFYSGLPGIAVCPTVQRPRDHTEATRFAKMLADPPLGLEHLEALPQASLLHKTALSIEPNILLPALLQDVDVRWQSTEQINFAERTIGPEFFDAIIVANGYGLGELCPELELIGRLGQVNWLQTAPLVPASALAQGQYAVAMGETRLWGATFEDYTAETPLVSISASDTNRAGLERLAPYWWQSVQAGDIQARASVRSTTADRLPLIGGVPDIGRYESRRREFERRQWHSTDHDPVFSNCYVAGGFGSRGFTWGPWAAEFLVAELAHWPSPISDEARRVVAPSRQILRRMKRR